MKKLLLILVIPLLMGAGCSVNFGNDDSVKVKELEEKVAQLEAKEEVKEVTEEATTTKAIEDEVVEKESEVQVVEKIVYKEVSVPTPEPIIEPEPEPEPEPESELEKELEVKEFLSNLDSAEASLVFAESIFGDGLKATVAQDYSTAITKYEYANTLYSSTYNEFNTINIPKTSFYGTLWDIVNAYKTYTSTKRDIAGIYVIDSVYMRDGNWQASEQITFPQLEAKAPVVTKWNNAIDEKLPGFLNAVAEYLD